jgi:glycosyltransferase involved in cell wall biosynthesis/thioredoxin-like negative regulator of GroEL
MALNEHDPNGPSTAAESDAVVAEQAVIAQTSAVVNLAEQALVAGDPAAYAEAVEAVATVGHRDRRHQARLRVLERAFEPRPSLSQQDLARIITVSLRGLAGWLEENPREPTLLGYAGVLAVEIGIYREAEALLEGALRLNPELPDIADSLKIARDRRKLKATVTNLPVDVKAALPRLRERLAKVASQAHPAEGLTLSLCMIVRDEEEMLGRCLEAVKDGVDEMIIVDTGSRDRTVEIAESYGAKVLYHEWTGDFAEARNVGLDAATGDWILKMDADEVFIEGDGARLNELKGQTWREAFYFEMSNRIGDEDDGMSARHMALVMFRNRPGRRYQGIVHEHMAHTLPGYLPERLGYTDLRMDHYGYLAAVRVDRNKTSRNMDLLLEQLEEGDDSAFLHFNLGSEYAGTDADTDGQSLKHFQRAWDLTLADPQYKLLGFMPSLCIRYIRALRVAEDWPKMDAAAAIIHERFVGFTDIYFEEAIAAFDRGQSDRGRELLYKCLELGDAPGLYSPTDGCGTYLAEMQLAKHDFDEGKVQEGEDRLRRTRREYPGYLGLIDPLASVMLARGASPDEVYEELTQSDIELMPSGWFMVAVNLQERGHREQAEKAFRGALERRPTLDAARVGLADALLVQGRVEEAAEQAAMVPFDKRVGGPALRTALFARLALDEGEDLDLQRLALAEQLPETDLDEAEQDVLRAWTARRTGVGEVPALDRASIDRMTPLLDSLLRLGAADAFADLLSLLPETGVDHRTQHEIVGTLFLRRGLAELAAEEWIAAINETGPDAAAYAGLAEAARLQGLLDDAKTLAAEALNLEPDNPLASRVLEATAA